MADNSNLTYLTNTNFKQEVIDSGKLFMVDFWAPWCGPCLAIAPSVEELATEYEGRAAIGKVNIDENQEIALEYGIRSIPTLLFFRGGELIDHVVGALPKNALAKKLDSLLEHSDVN